MGAVIPALSRAGAFGKLKRRADPTDGQRPLFVIASRLLAPLRVGVASAARGVALRRQGG
jgi:hypothetical protein